jgi:hypothetical protein
VKLNASVFASMSRDACVLSGAGSARDMAGVLDINATWARTQDPGQSAASSARRRLRV